MCLCLIGFTLKPFDKKVLDVLPVLVVPWTSSALVNHVRAQSRITELMFLNATPYEYISFPPHSPESEMNLNWLRAKSSCQGRISGAEAVAGQWLVTKGGVGGQAGLAYELPRSSLFVAREFWRLVLKPLGCLTIWKAGWVWQGWRWVLGG